VEFGFTALHADTRRRPKIEFVFDASMIYAPLLVAIRSAHHLSTSSASQTVTFADSLNGFGNVPAFDQAQILDPETSKS
jgi:hypothetical protein